MIDDLPEQRIHFTIPGDPTGKGRPKFDTRGPYVRAVTPQKTENYESLVKLCYQSQCGSFAYDKSDALGIRITAYKSIPKGTSGRKTESMLAGLVRPTKKPDWDNIGKIICDALNKIAYYDDAQIIEAAVHKKYSDQPRVEVELWRESLGG